VLLLTLNLKIIIAIRDAANDAKSGASLAVIDAKLKASRVEIVAKFEAWLTALEAGVRASRVAVDAELRASRFAIDVQVRASRAAVDDELRASRAAIDAGLGASRVAIDAKFELRRKAAWKVEWEDAYNEGLGNSRISDQEELCSICTEDFIHVVGIGAQLSCSHRFHTSCLKPWIERNRTCPLCRHSIN